MLLFVSLFPLLDFVYAGTDNTAGIATAPASETELPRYGFEANKFAESELSVSIPENGSLAYISFLVPSFFFF